MESHIFLIFKKSNSNLKQGEFHEYAVFCTIHRFDQIIRSHLPKDKFKQHLVTSQTITEVGLSQPFD